MAIVGYARVSSIGQNLEVQTKALNKFGCGKIYSEKRTGTTTARPELKACLDYVRDGDILVITKLDRLARSTLHLHKIIDELNTKKVGFKVLDQSIDTTTKEGRLMFSILASIAEFETALRAERQAEGIKNALSKGVKFGAKPKLTPDQIEEMRHKRSEGVKIKTLMNDYGISKASVYRLMDDEFPYIRAVEEPMHKLTPSKMRDIAFKRHIKIDPSIDLDNKDALHELCISHFKKCDGMINKSKIVEYELHQKGESELHEIVKIAI